MAFAKKTIDGVEYEMRAMDPLLVLEHGSKLTSELAAPAIDKLSQSGKLEATPQAMLIVGASLIGEMLKKMSAPSVQAAIQDLFPYASAGGRELDKTWKVHFMGKTKAMITFIAWGIEVQFGDFFVGLGEQIAGVLKERFASLASPTEPSK